MEYINIRGGERWERPQKSTDNDNDDNEENGNDYKEKIYIAFRLVCYMKKNVR